MKQTILILMLVFNINASGQKENIIPPSPQAQLIENYYQKYFSSEISPSGTERIDVGLYDMIVSDIKIPISLSYSTGGIRFKQEDGDVGVGWNVVPNLRISRTVIGRPDEELKRVVNITTELSNLGTYPPDQDKYITQFALGVSGDEYGSSNYSDMGADIFSFSTLKNSGHFIFPDANDFSKIEIIEKINVNITATRDVDGMLSFYIIDEDGMRYSFGGDLASYETAYQGGLNASIVTGWPVSTIQSPKGENVSFKYISYIDNETIQPENKTLTITDAYRAMSWGVYYNFPYSKDYGLESHNSYPNYRTFYVSEMESRNQIVKFNRNGRVLSSISVTDKINSTTIKNISLSYSGITKKPHYFLDDVTIDDQKYQFQYYSTADLGMSPDYQSDKFTSDLWGFYLYDQFGDFTVNNFPILHTQLKDAKFNFAVGNLSNPTYIRDISVLLSDSSFKNSSNNLYGHLFSIKKMTLPTKGYIQYEYEPNKYVHNSETIVGAGSRIKKITSYDLSTGLYIKEYNYGQGTYNNYIEDKGLPSWYISPFDYTSEQMTRLKRWDFNPTADMFIPGSEKYFNHLSRTFSPSVVGDFSLAQDFVIEYPIITISSISRFSEYYGKVIYKFNIKQQKYFEQMYRDYAPLDYRTRSSLNVSDYRFGFKTNIEGKKYYTIADDLIKEEIYTYDVTNNCRTIDGGIKINQAMIANYNEDPNYSLPPFTDSIEIDRPRQFSYMPFGFFTGRELLSSKTIKEYGVNGNSFEFATTHTYGYNSKNQMSSDIFINSKGETIKKEYKYPSDLVGQKPMMQELVNSNQIESPVITNFYLNNNLIGQSETEHSEFHRDAFSQSHGIPGSILPAVIYNKKGSGIISSIDRRLTYNSYDSFGNLTQYTTENGIPVSIIWGYLSTKPIAVIENATYASITPSLITAAQASTDSFDEFNEPSTALNNLRNDPSLVNAMVSTYTYIPLVGISMITDPKGDTITYEYDAFNRLKSVRDKDGNILSENEYYYKY